MIRNVVKLAIEWEITNYFLCYFATHLIAARLRGFLNIHFLYIVAVICNNEMVKIWQECTFTRISKFSCFEYSYLIKSNAHKICVFFKFVNIPLNDMRVKRQFEEGLGLLLICSMQCSAFITGW